MTVLTKRDIAELIISCDGICLDARWNSVVGKYFHFDCSECPIHTLCISTRKFHITKRTRDAMKLEAARIYLEEISDKDRDG